MPEISLPSLPADSEFCVISRPNDSLPPRVRWFAFAALAGVSLVVALAFTVAGAWPVLPFSLLELAGLAVAFLIIERRARRWQRLTVAGDRVIVENGAPGRSDLREFNRRWLRVEVEERGFARQPRLTLRFAGEAMEFGQALSPERRVELAKALRRLTAAH